MDVKESVKDRQSLLGTAGGAFNSSSWQCQQQHTAIAPEAAPWQHQAAYSSPTAHNKYQFYQHQQGPCFNGCSLGGTAGQPGHSAVTSPIQQAQQQQPGWLGVTKQPHRIHNGAHARSISNVELYSSFDSLSINSSGPTSCPHQLNCTGTSGTDALPVGSVSSLYPPLPSYPTQQQPLLQHLQQQGSMLHASSLGKSSSSSYRACSTQWPAAGPGSGNLGSRTHSLGSSGSGRYPSIPGCTTSSSSSSSSGSCLFSRSGSTGSEQLASCSAAGGTDAQQRRSQVQHQLSLSPLDQCRQRQQQWKPSEGLYPLLSDAECGPPQQQAAGTAAAFPEAPWGYQLQVQLLRVQGLPIAADPYVLVVMHLDGHDVQYRTDPQWSTQMAVYGEADGFTLENVQQGGLLRCEVWDKNLATEDVLLGRATWALTAYLQNESGIAAVNLDGVGICGGDSGDQQAQEGPAAAVTMLELLHPTRTTKQAGQLLLKVVVRPSSAEGSPRMTGPVRFRQHLCPTAGLLAGHWSEDVMCFSTYKLFLCQIGSVFKDVRMPWNKDYDKARMIFETPLLTAVQAQHKAMYATQSGTTRGGVLHSAADFFQLFNNGVRAEQQRFFTYTLCSDSFRCSETGAAVFIDMFSKHAMHAGGATEVLYAGEFCIMPDDRATAGYKLVLDNNSGTFAPHKAKLSLLKQLFNLNFPEMKVEVWDMRDPMLTYYQSLCPSRSVPAPAAPVAAVMPNRKAPQFMAG